MAIEQKSIAIAKEADDVMKLVVEVVKHFRAGKGIKEAAELLDELMAAIAGADQIDDELRANKEAVFNAVLIGASSIVAELLKEKDPAPAA